MQKPARSKGSVAFYARQKSKGSVALYAREKISGSVTSKDARWSPTCDAKGFSLMFAAIHFYRV